MMIGIVIFCGGFKEKCVFDINKSTLLHYVFRGQNTTL